MLKATHQNNIKLDWKTYFKHFDQAHGGEAIPLGLNRLLYEDGWCYSSRSYSGPEYPPPDDPKRLALLKRFYYSRVKQLVQDELTSLLLLENQLRQLRSAKSLPLVRKITNKEYDETTGRPVISVDTSFLPEEGTEPELSSRIEYLKEKLEFCDRSLAEYNHTEEVELEPVMPFRRPGY